ncbi:oxalate decarboxylase [Phyllobacterium trifolii]|uniref:Oxalate decarboxylase n=1 Tax=Phyllobacterium trifolii TaxID=300193 RepID=A0A839UE42_9HYPH|nr:cupin domain-containing protein [Phyllobacterium trifolii]MBB3148134.1 oxalate decarboxylase [Phyllobacterium trifolii]
MTIAKRKSQHVASLAQQTPRFESSEGSVSHVDSSDLPILRRLSIRRLLLGVHGVREPHWHANAHELGYCLHGEALVTMAGNHAQRESFIVAAGEMFFIPSGAIHSIENIGQHPVEFILAFSHEKPEDFGMKAAFAVMSDAVLGNTYDLPSAAFSGFDRSARPSEILSIPRQASVEDQARYINACKYSIEATPPQIDFPSGTARAAKAALWPVLRDIAMYSVTISQEGMREPHWHPETAEMGYITSGTARMTVLDPDGSSDTYTIRPGDTYFIPRAFPHHIENVGEGMVHLLIFFDQASPGDVGYRSLINVFPRGVIAADFGMKECDLPVFPFTEIDPLLVPRRNLTDPVP